MGSRAGSRPTDGMDGRDQLEADMAAARPRGAAIPRRQTAQRSSHVQPGALRRPSTSPSTQKSRSPTA
eukprot:3536345-Prymnesium_polylepis.1